MAHDAELTVTPPAEPARSAAAKRMRRHRERRRDGMRCLLIEQECKNAKRDDCIALRVGDCGSGTAPMRQKSRRAMISPRGGGDIFRNSRSILDVPDRLLALADEVIE
jgi:hypothetical protein